MSRSFEEPWKLGGGWVGHCLEEPFQTFKTSKSLQEGGGVGLSGRRVARSPKLDNFLAGVVKSRSILW